MKASNFTEAQKAFIIKQGENLPQSGDQPSDLIQLEEEVCRFAANRDEAAQRELKAEEDRGGPDA